MYTDEEDPSVSCFTDGLRPLAMDEPCDEQRQYDHLLDAIRLRKSTRSTSILLPSQIDGIYDEEDPQDSYRKPLMKRREFFAHPNGFPSVSV